jgi:hypothetical protein
MSARMRRARRAAVSAAFGLVFTFLPLFGNLVAFYLGYPNFGTRILILPFWPLVIFVPIFNHLGFDSYWFPHPFALLAALGFALVLYSLLVYGVLGLFAKRRC